MPYPSYMPSGVPWLGTIPAHWSVEKVKFLAQLRGEKNTGTPNGARYVGMEHVLPRVGKFCPVVDGTQEEAESTVNVFAKDDVLFGKLRPYLAKSVVAETDGVCSSEFLVLRPLESVYPKYLNATMLMQGFIDNVDASTYGAKMPRASWEFISQQRLPLPPLDEQQAIADYLDVETARIDALMFEKNELIGLLREWRQSVITEFTSGIQQPGKKKFTGNVHIPQIPLDWAMVRLGKYSRIGNGSTPLKDNAYYWTSGTFPWLNSAVVNQDEVKEASEYVTDEALRACHLPIVEAGALLVALTGQGKTRGQVAILRIRATINQHLAYLAFDSQFFDAKFLFWTLTGLYAALRMVSDGQGGTKGALTCEDLSRFEVPMPPLSEQKRIAEMLSNETGKIDDLIIHTKDELVLLKELRNATIADAVLGRIDVRTTTN
jgi:type I restriction enzyme S subunit